jgi:hypothetical protein
VAGVSARGSQPSPAGAGYELAVEEEAAAWTRKGVEAVDHLGDGVAPAGTDSHPSVVHEQGGAPAVLLPLEQVCGSEGVWWRRASAEEMLGGKRRARRTARRGRLNGALSLQVSRSDPAQVSAKDAPNGSGHVAHDGTISPGVIPR